MKKHFLIFCTLLFTNLNFTLSAHAQYTTEIYGKITCSLPDSSPKKVSVITPDFFNTEVYNTDIQKDGTYHIQFKKYYASIVFLKFASRPVPIFIRPGEKLAVHFNPSQFDTAHLQFVGNSPSSTLNQTLIAWNKQRIKPSRYNQLMKDLSFQKVQDSITLFKKQEMRLLQQFCLNNQCSRAFLQQARLDILYKEANQLMRFRWYQPVINKADPIKVIPQGYHYAFTRKFNLNSTPALTSLNYRDYIHEHNLHWHYVAYNKKALDPDKIDPKKELYWILQNIEEGLARDLMLAENYTTLIRSGDKTLINKLSPHFLEKIDFQPAKDYIKTLWKTYQ